MLGRPVSVHNGSIMDLDYVGVKAPQFSFMRIEGADPVLGVEMNSTGEVGCLGDDFEEAFLKALLSVGFRLPVTRVLLSTGPVEHKAAFLESARTLCDLGVELFATEGTVAFLAENGIQAHRLHWPNEASSPNAMEYLGQRRLDLVINIPKNTQEEELTNDYLIRRGAADFGIPLITNIQLAQRLVEAIKRPDELQVKSWQEYAPKTASVRAPGADTEVSLEPAITASGGA
jgi:carbamoyl-phosphate synthase large subunit